MLLYGAAVVFLMLNERKIIYQPTAFNGRQVVPPAPDLGVSEHRVLTADSVALTAWVAEAIIAEPLDLWILACHGNAGNISGSGRQEWMRHLLSLGAGVVAFDYRSYGSSDDGDLSEEALIADTRAVYDWMVHTLGIAPSRIVLYGHSLGSGVASRMAANVEAAGVIIEGGFTSLPDVGSRHYPWMPVKLLARERYESARWLQIASMPKLFLHAIDDRVIPYELGQQLFEAAQTPKEFVSLTGGHDIAFRTDSATYWTGVGNWLRTVAAPDMESPELAYP